MSAPQPLSQDKYIEKRNDLMGRLHNSICKDIRKRQVTPPEALMVLKVIEREVIEQYEYGVMSGG